MAALIYRASELGTITSSQSANLWRQMAMRGYRKVEPNELDREATYRVASMLLTTQ
jgi:Zn-dependent peptidase ImmA (M78 family)